MPGAPHAAFGDRRSHAGSRMIVIVGAGQAAAQLVLSLRQGGYKEPIRMIGDEPYAPYQRPPLSKKFLTERPPADTLYFRPEKFWGEQGVVAAFGVSVNAIDRAAKRVTFADGHAEYETLFLSTGTRAPRSANSGRAPRWRVLAAQDRRRTRAARPDGCRQAHRHRRWRLHRARGGGCRAQRGAGGHRARSRGARDEARHLAGDLALHAGLPSQSRRRHPCSARGSPPSRAARRCRR